MFKTEKLLILLAGIFSSITVFFGFLGVFFIEQFKNNEMFKDLMKSAGETVDISTIELLIPIFILLVIAISFFVLRSKLTLQNHKIIGIILIGIAALIFVDITGPIAAILSVIAGIMILVNAKKYTETETVVEQE